jgi:hypothetical protein
VASDFRLAQPAPRKKSIGLPVYILGALLLVCGSLLFYYLKLAPAKTAEAPLTAEARAYTEHLKLADVTMKATGNYFAQTVVEIQGSIENTGDRNLDTVEIYCVFSDGYGQMVLRQRLPIVSARMGGLKPGEKKSFRLPFDQIPESWNQKMPQLVIASVKFS